MFIIYVIVYIIYQPKMKCKDGGLYFCKSQKYGLLQIEKKNSVISFQKFLIFHICVFFRKCSMFCRSIPLIERSRYNCFFASLLYCIRWLSNEYYWKFLHESTQIRISKYIEHYAKYAEIQLVSNLYFPV